MSSFRLDIPAFGEHVLRSDGMKKEMVRRAKLVMDRAVATAPVDTGNPQTGRKPEHPGRYKRSFRVSSGIRVGARGSRVYGRVTNDSPEAFWVEVGTKNNQRYRTLGKARDAAKG